MRLESDSRRFEKHQVYVGDYSNVNSSKVGERAVMPPYPADATVGNRAPDRAPCSTSIDDRDMICLD